MPLPGFTTTGDLPLGVHQATLQEVIARFGGSTAQRQVVAMRLQRVYNIARGTAALARFVICGSFITDKPAPNDVAVFMVMEDHFWTKRSGIIGTEQEAIEDWQIKRDHSYRGIVEVVEEKP